MTTCTRPCLGREFHGVGEQVPKDLLEPVFVPHDDAADAGEGGGEPDALALGRRAHGLHGGGDDGGEVDPLHVEADLAGFDAAHVEQILDQLRLRAHVALDDFERLRARSSGVAPFFRICDPAEDGVQRRAQLVRERGRNSAFIRSARLSCSWASASLRERRAFAR